jgi:hypothetical protein
VLLSLFLAWQHSFTGLKASVDTDRVPVSVPLMEGILPETWIPWNACGLGLASWFAEGQATHRDLGSEVVCLGNEAGRETVEGKRYVEGNSYAIRLSLNLTAGWKPRNSLVASVADWLAFRGRRAGRTVCSRPRSLAVSRTHFSLPYGRPLSMLTRTRSNSFVVKGALKRAVQFVGRATTDQVAAGEPQPSHARTPQIRTAFGTYVSCGPIGSGRDRQGPQVLLSLVLA